LQHMMNKVAVIFVIFLCFDGTFMSTASAMSMGKQRHKATKHPVFFVDQEEEEEGDWDPVKKWNELTPRKRNMIKGFLAGLLILIVIILCVVLIPNASSSPVTDPVVPKNGGNVVTCVAGTHIHGVDINGVPTSCLDCAAGEFSSVDNSVTCSTCSAGTFSAAKATVCTNCAPSQYSHAGAHACIACSSTVCDAGLFWSSAGETSCNADATRATPPCGTLYCAAGTYMSGASCVACAAGTFSAAQASSCTPCDGSEYSAVGAASCVPCSSATCPTGETWSVAGETSCSADTTRVTSPCSTPTPTPGPGGGRGGGNFDDGTH